MGGGPVKKEKPACDIANAKIYIQYSCNFEDIVIDYQLKALYVTTTALICCFAYFY